MLTGWTSFKGWICLEFFLLHPTSQIHVRDLSRKLHISPLTANTYLKNYYADGVLARQKYGNAIFYRLNQTPFTIRLKQAYVLSQLEKIHFVTSMIKLNPAITSIVLYGTRASGTYDEKSDYDFLVISKYLIYPQKVIAAMDARANFMVVDLATWRKMNSAFKASVERNHVVLFGAGLVMG